MSILLETNLGGDIVIDLDLKGSPILCKNVLKLAQIRYFTSCLVFNVQRNRFFQTGDPTGTGQGGACIYGVLQAGINGESSKESTITSSQTRFLKSSSGRRLTLSECRERGRVVAMELNHTKDTIGSQFMITLGRDRPGDALDGYLDGGDQDDSYSRPLSLGVVTEDDDGVLEKIESAYCDTDGRPYADIRILRVLVLHDPFSDPPAMGDYFTSQPGLVIENEHIIASPDRSKPPEESVPERISVNELDVEGEETEEQMRSRKEVEARQEDHQRAVVLELLGDLPSADYKAPEHVLFVCKLNPITQDEDLELIFSRFDPKCKAEIIRDPETGNSLQYAFVEFSNKQQCVEAYFKMNNALIDDRRIKVDFSQSVAKLWDKHTQRLKARERKGIMQTTRDPGLSAKRSLDEHHHKYHGKHTHHQRPPPFQQMTLSSDQSGLNSRQHTYGPRNDHTQDQRHREARNEERHQVGEGYRDPPRDRTDNGRNRTSDDDGSDVDRRRRDRKRDRRDHGRRDSADDRDSRHKQKKHRRHDRYDRDDEDLQRESRTVNEFEARRRSREDESSHRNRSHGDDDRKMSGHHRPNESGEDNRRHRRRHLSDDDNSKEMRKRRPEIDMKPEGKSEHRRHDEADDDTKRPLGRERRSSDEIYLDRKRTKRSGETEDRKRRKNEAHRHRDDDYDFERRRRHDERDSDDDDRRIKRDRKRH